MKVTGWTEWEDPNYIDITQENTKKRCAVMNSVPKLMDIDDFKKLTENEKETYLEGRKSDIDKAFENYDRSGEELEAEIREAVIIELREKGYHFFGEHHQNHPRGTPIIDNKYIYCVSMREWGAVMAEAYPDEDYALCYDDNYRYCKWAWYSDDLKNNVKFPE